MLDVDTMVNAVEEPAPTLVEGQAKEETKEELQVDLTFLEFNQ